MPKQDSFRKSSYQLDCILKKFLDCCGKKGIVASFSQMWIISFTVRNPALSLDLKFFETRELFPQIVFDSTCPTVTHSPLS